MVLIAYFMVLVAVAGVFALMAAVELLIIYEQVRRTTLKKEEVKRNGVQGSRDR